MGMGYALTEQYEIKEGRPISRFGTLGLFRADKVPHIESMIIEKTGVEPGYAQSELERSHQSRQLRRSREPIIN